MKLRFPWVWRDELTRAQQDLALCQMAREIEGRSLVVLREWACKGGLTLDEIMQHRSVEEAIPAAIARLEQERDTARQERDQAKQLNTILAEDAAYHANQAADLARRLLGLEPRRASPGIPPRSPKPAGSGRGKKAK